jgi:hypothetical protein
MSIDYSQFLEAQQCQQYLAAGWDAVQCVREAAYYLWQNAGCPHGRDQEFWLEAEREIYGYTSDEYYDLLEEQVWDDGSLNGYRGDSVFIDGATEL